MNDKVNVKVTKCKPGEYLRVTYFCTSCQTNSLKAGPGKNSLLGWASSVGYSVYSINLGNTERT